MSNFIFDAIEIIRHPVLSLRTIDRQNLIKYSDVEVSPPPGTIIEEFIESDLKTANQKMKKELDWRRKKHK
jgi:hypothetical protein